MSIDRIDFVVAGTQKGGTTALDAILRHHPEILMPRKKELHFFDNDGNFPVPGDAGYAAYHSNWERGTAGAKLGEATPSYMFRPKVMERLASYRADLRIICVLRDPVRRAYSHWNQDCQLGRETLSFEQALAAERSQGEGGRRAYIARGRYPAQIERIWRHFPRERTLFLRQEWLRNAQQPTMDLITDFIGVARHEFGSPTVAHQRSYERAIRPTTARALRREFSADVRELEKLLGWDCSEWLEDRDSLVRWGLGELRHALLALPRAVKARLVQRR